VAGSKRVLLVAGNQRELRGHIRGERVLVKTPNGWKIALGHTSLLTEAQK